MTYPTYPPHLHRYTINVEDVELICNFEYEPQEINYPDAPDIPACMNLINALCEGIDIAHLLMQSVVDTLCEEGLIKFNSESEE